MSSLVQHFWVRLALSGQNVNFMFSERIFWSVTNDLCSAVVLPQRSPFSVSAVGLKLFLWSYCVSFRLQLGWHGAWRLRLSLLQASDVTAALTSSSSLFWFVSNLPNYQTHYRRIRTSRVLIGWPKNVKVFQLKSGRYFTRVKRHGFKWVHVSLEPPTHHTNVGVFIYTQMKSSGSCSNQNISVTCR